MNASKQPKTNDGRTTRRVILTTVALAGLVAFGLAPSASADLASVDSCSISPETTVIYASARSSSGSPVCATFGMDQGITTHADVSITSRAVTGGCMVTWSATVSATNPGFVFDYTWIIGKVNGSPQLRGTSHALNGPVNTGNTEFVAKGASLNIIADIENDDLGIDDATANPPFRC